VQAGVERRPAGDEVTLGSCGSGGGDGDGDGDDEVGAWGVGEGGAPRPCPRRPGARNVAGMPICPAFTISCGNLAGAAPHLYVEPLPAHWRARDVRRIYEGRELEPGPRVKLIKFDGALTGPEVGLVGEVFSSWPSPRMTPRRRA
jgi:hypothetical protein